MKTTDFMMMNNRNILLLPTPNLKSEWLCQKQNLLPFPIDTLLTYPHNITMN